MKSNVLNIHVDYAPEHEALTFSDTGGESILSYRRICTTRLRDKNGPVPDGWILNYLDDDGRVQEHIIGGRLLDVNGAVDDAKEYIRRFVMNSPE